MSEIRQSINNIVNTWRTRREEYQPSYFIIAAMDELIGNNFIDYCSKERLVDIFDRYIDELATTEVDGEFPEVNPGPFYYLDSNNFTQVCLYIEMAYVDALSNATYQRMMETMMNMAETPAEE